MTMTKDDVAHMLERANNDESIQLIMECEWLLAELDRVGAWARGLAEALSHQTVVADAERGRADRAEAALAECGRAGCPCARERQ